MHFKCSVTPWGQWLMYWTAPNKAEISNGQQWQSQHRCVTPTRFWLGCSLSPVHHSTVQSDHLTFRPHVNTAGRKKGKRKSQKADYSWFYPHFFFSRKIIAFPEPLYNTWNWNRSHGLPWLGEGLGWWMFLLKYCY